MKKANTTISALSKKLKKEIPLKTCEVLESYEDFCSSQKDLDNPKEFGSYHTACKAAIAHIENLLKLISWAEKKSLKDKKSSEETDILRLLQQAKDEIDAAEKENFDIDFNEEGEDEREE